MFLENNEISGSKVPRKIDLEERRVYVPTPMIQEIVPSMPYYVAPSAVAPPVGSSSEVAPSIVAPIEDAPAADPAIDTPQMEEPAHDNVPNDEPQ